MYDSEATMWQGERIDSLSELFGLLSEPVS